MNAPDRSRPGDLRLVIISGLSGAGKTQALRSLEDLGFFCIDNLPPALLTKFADLCAQSGQKVRRIALVIDVRGGQFFDDLLLSLRELEEAGIWYEVLFLEAGDEVLVRRFKETRRRHPLAATGGILEAIREERKRLEEIRGRARIIIDTSDLTPGRLREEIFQLFSEDSPLERFVIRVVTFGYKHGLPRDADLVFDVRFLPNPYYVESLKHLSGNDRAVVKYVMKWPVTQEFMKLLEGLIGFLIPHYKNEGKTQLTIAIGCTGGRHRSVVVAERLAEALRRLNNVVLVEHRDISLGEA